MSDIISIFIPGNIQPFERGKRFIDPLEAALQREDLGEVVEEGTHLETVGDRQVVKGCQIDVEVTSRQKCLPVIRRILLEASAPAKTTITLEGRDESQIERLGEDIE